MSPEQARGKPVDKRADIWSFGCVLYEMLTGRRAFEGEDVSETLAAILRADPDWSLIPADVSVTVRQYLKRCLARDPAQRVHDIADVRLALEGAFDVPVEAPQVPSAAASRGRLWKTAIVSASVAAVLAGALGAYLTWRLLPGEQAKVARLAIAPPPGVAMTPTAGDIDVAVSRDGSRVAFVVLGQGRFWMYVRRLDLMVPVRIEGVNSPRAPFFSPDGETLGFFDGLALKRVSANGGPVLTITPVQGSAGGASWGEDGSIVFSTSVTNGLMRVSAGGGEAVRLTTAPQGLEHILPEVLPGGRAVLLHQSQPPAHHPPERTERRNCHARSRVGQHHDLDFGRQPRAVRLVWPPRLRVFQHAPGGRIRRECADDPGEPGARSGRSGHKANRDGEFRLVVEWRARL
jgi:serine/threonine-protein kinase